MLGNDIELAIPARSAAAAAPRRRVHPLAAAFGAVYLTAAIVLLADPQPVLDWLDDLDPGPLVAMARGGMGAVAGLSAALGLSSASAAVRSRTTPLLKRPL